MRKSNINLVFTAFMTLLCICSAHAQPVWEGDFRITVDNETLISLLSGYSEVTGDLAIVETTLSSLSGL